MHAHLLGEPSVTRGQRPQCGSCGMLQVRSVLGALQEGKAVKECAQKVEECQGLRTSFFACKKGQADPRSRIQGQKGY